MANEVRVAWEPLKAFAREIFIKLGMPPEDAETEVSVMTWANLRGVDSHGVMLIPTYMEWIDREVMNPKPNIQVLKETPANLAATAAISYDAEDVAGRVARREKRWTPVTALPG